jgi:hypothetical protein
VSWLFLWLPKKRNLVRWSESVNTVCNEKDDKDVDDDMAREPRVISYGDEYIMHDMSKCCYYFHSISS